MRKLTELRRKASRAESTGRSIVGVVQSQKFERLWKESTKEEKETAYAHVENSEHRGLLAWMFNHKSLDLGEMSAAQLRQLARRAKIRNYSRKLKFELVRDMEAHYEKVGYVRDNGADRTGNETSTGDTKD